MITPLNMPTGTGQSSLYNAAMLTASPDAQVLLCDSVEAAEASQQWLSGRNSGVIATAPEGDLGRVDWRPVKERTIGLLIDPAVEGMFVEATHPFASTIKVIDRPAGAVSGWTLADAPEDFSLKANARTVYMALKSATKGDAVADAAEAPAGSIQRPVAPPAAPAPALTPARPGSKSSIDFTGLIGPVARHLLGEPNAAEGSSTDLRYGTNGSLSINIEKDAWYDFEKCVGGGVLALVVHQEQAQDEDEAACWIEQRGLATGAVVTAVSKAVPAQFKIVATYPYKDRSSALLYEVCRLEPKSFRQRRPDGQGGVTWSVKGVTQVPYRLPELLMAASDAIVFIPEGEKDVDNILAIGLTASCNAGGAGKWPDDLTPHFSGRHVALLEDNDDAGRAHVRMVASKLSGVAASVRILQLPGLPPKGDVSDWLDAGGMKKQLLQMASAAPEVSAEPATASPAPYAEYDGSTFFDPSLDGYGEPRTKQPPFAFTRVGDMLDNLKPIEWLIKGYLEADSLALLFSDPGVGKSFMAIDMACCIATGRPWHDNAAAKGAVFMIAGEGHNGLVRRFKAWEIANGVSLAGAPLYVSHKAAAFCDAENAKSVIEAVRALAVEAGAQPRLIVVDTVARNFGPGDENSTKEMGEFIQHLDELKHEFNATVLLVHHSGHGDKSRARGSMALKGALDAEYRLERDDAGKVIRFEATKMKDAEAPAPLSFQLQGVKLPLFDEDGNVVFGAAIRSAAHTEKPVPGKKGGGKNQTLGLRILLELEREHRATVAASGREEDEARVHEDSWRDRLAESKLPRNRFHEVKKGLLDAGSIAYEGLYVRSA